jgi:hypothetical protein
MYQLLPCEPPRAVPGQNRSATKDKAPVSSFVAATAGEVLGGCRPGTEGPGVTSWRWLLGGGQGQRRWRLTACGG